jgi:teichuronic acid biosynthesis glycosyltransferase TuaG
LQNYSVIVPVFNGERYIMETLKSVEAQSLRPSEIIVVDDRSTDTTPALVRSFQGQSEIPTKFVRLGTNSGSAAKPRNKGLENIGDVQYVAFCDADDVWHVDKMKTQIRLMEKDGSVFSFGKVKFFKGSSELVHKKLKPTSTLELEIRDFRFDNCIKSCSTAVICSPLIGLCHFPEGVRYRGIEDYYCWLGILSSVEKVTKVVEELAFYRQHDNSISSSKLSMARLRFRTFSFKKNIFAKKSIFLPNIVISEIIYILKQVASKI